MEIIIPAFLAVAIFSNCTFRVRSFVDLDLMIDDRDIKMNMIRLVLSLLLHL